MNTQKALELARDRALELKPRNPGERLPEYEQEGWRGDLEQYYKPIELEG